MHLPYIRKMFEARMNSQKDVKIVPLMVGQVPADRYPAYARSLLPYFMDDRCLFVVSSDFCHWGKRFRFTHRFDDFEEKYIYESIKKLDH